MRDNTQSMAMAQTTRLSGQALSGEKQSAVSDNTVDHSAIRAGPQWLETVSSQWQNHRLLGYQGSPSAKRDSQQLDQETFFF